MTPELAVQILRDALMSAFWLSAPLLLMGFAVSTAVNILQILTSLQDSVISTVPRLAVFLFLFIILLPWMTGQLMTYTSNLFSNLWKYAA